MRTLPKSLIRLPAWQPGRFDVVPVRRVLLPIWILAVLALSGCASPTTQLRELASRQGFDRSRVTVNGFRHTVFMTPPAERADVLHVYLEGDGSPWRHRTMIMADPTPRSPLMLRLMAKDTAAAVYVGRPCYNGSASDEGCSNRLWTSDRYSETVVASMTGVVRRLQQRAGAHTLRLFGHSGGGALAMLIAERLPAVSDVVTIAGNLDTDAWTDHHGYTPLYGSLNPARRAPLADSVREWHLVGERDTVIPPQLVNDFLQRRPRAESRQVAGYSHGCCWERSWRLILHAVTNDTPMRLPGIRYEARAESSSAG